ncbi:hypothetical protein BCV69DRAFT_298931 [Microstroma glucosiphilum]|uniref:Uncharacterized protein n=1 Tax=Pseudomicrostroma glucosiphilum TaxID=1684307 RepID=A0A316U9R9_9BASI|nr:hypothetical protein BCV69DRAFT_298931 [Pseudomicrostroma glucosiphilum]PWN21153.1 hypothetical protein BCV69DRAFT_298931 [Pseudomicrostroma glucosiphilum]
MTDAERKIQRLTRQLGASNAGNLKLRIKVKVLEAKVNRLSLLSLPSQPTQRCEELARALMLKSQALELAMSLLEKERAHADCLAARASSLATLYQAGPPDPQDALLDQLLAEIAGEAEKGRTTEGESAEAASKQLQEAEEVQEGLASTRAPNR